MTMLFAVAMIAIFATTDFVDARGGGGFGGGGGGRSSSSFSGSSSSSRSSSSSSSHSSSSGSGSSGFSNSSSNKASSSPSNSGFSNSASKPSAAPAATAPSASGFSNSSQKAAASPSNSGFSNSSNAPAAATAAKPTVKMTPLQEKMNKNYSREESTKARADYTAEQNKFKQPAAGNVIPPSVNKTQVVNNIKVYNYPPGTYESRRTVFYSNYNYIPPAYVFGSYSRFGIWDAAFLGLMLERSNDRQYAENYYHHRDDEDMRAWRKEMDRMAQNDAELKAKLQKLDEETEKIKASGLKVNAAYVPPDAGDIALAKEVADEAAAKDEPKPESEESSIAWGWIFGIGAICLIVGLIIKARRG